ncbi:MAG TPA: lipopolysaccharide heptosyltransferase II [Candidatus Eisenbacteria bacterium]|jgi:heptosyltransferase-2|nr:lipopolysaccharide heptosyltransferase II [Candidatus Eisenbacteria bacterium]
MKIPRATLSSTPAGPGTEKILVRGVNWLGDAVMTTPALQRLREARPDAEITLLTPSKLADLWRDYPSVDRVMTFSKADRIGETAQRLRREDFHAGIAFPNSIRSALELWLARIPERVGYARSWRNVFLTLALAPRPGAVPMHQRSAAEVRELVRNNSVMVQFPATAHHLHDYLHLTAALGANPEPVPPRLNVTESEVKHATEKFGLASNPQQPVFGLNPGAEYGAAKRWPSERFVAAAREIKQRTNCLWIIFGGKGDVDLAAKIHTGIVASPAPGLSVDPSQKAGVLNLAGATSLRELAALLKACEVVLTNDTGPMHLAAALGTPVVALFGSTSPAFTSPGLPGSAQNVLLQSPVPCAPCFRRECPIDFRCMNNLTVAAVVGAVLDAAQR